MFERGPNKVVLTALGKPIITQAQQLLEAVDKLRRIVRGGDCLVEPLRIGVIYTVGPYLLPHLIPMLRAQAPEMPIIVEEGFTADLRVRLKQGSLDALILSNPFHEPGVDTAPLYSEPFVVVLSIAHPWTQKKHRTHRRIWLTRPCCC